MILANSDQQFERGAKVNNFAKGFISAKLALFEVDKYLSSVN